MKNQITPRLAVLSLLLLGGCASTDQTANSSRAQFLDEVWVAPEVQGKAPADLYTAVYFSPVTVDQLQQQGWWKSQGAKTQAQIQADAIKLAAYMSASMQNAARSYPNAKLPVVLQPGPGVLVVDTAITELVPAKAFWNGAATAAGFVVPGAGLLGAAGRGSIGIEGQLRDGGTGAVLANFRERESDQMAAVNLASYTWYQGSQANIDEFSQKAAQFLNAPAGATVKRSLPVKLVAF